MVSCLTLDYTEIRKLSLTSSGKGGTKTRAGDRSTRHLAVGAAGMAVPGPPPLSLLQHDTVHPLHVGAEVVDPVEPPGTEFALVLQEVGIVDGSVAPHGVRRREVLVADVAGKTHLLLAARRQQRPQKGVRKQLHRHGPVIDINDRGGGRDGGGHSGSSIMRWR